MKTTARGHTMKNLLLALTLLISTSTLANEMDNFFDNTISSYELINKAQQNCIDTFLKGYKSKACTMANQLFSMMIDEMMAFDKDKNIDNLNKEMEAHKKFNELKDITSKYDYLSSQIRKFETIRHNDFMNR